MSKKSTRRATRNQSPVSGFFRRPAVQIGILALAAIIITLIVLAGNNGKKISASNLPNDINADQAYTLYQQGGAVFVDVRTQGEWNNFHLQDALLIPIDELAARVNEVPRDKPIVVICQSGSRSPRGRDILRQAGFSNITSVSGGLGDWMQLGYPVVYGQ
ncbi:MAG: hypothetical protein CO094_13995 [Anaerolineae bacterium CG_4_9_14_3_um_filter_57_17]|nr:rhodanese-like domain-containing protein [bacterium]NCT21939.1 rhodanese-like domain-containing protein [bacterium]PJB64108.1 MAG: hypothetical protein CO094_13995 [Anaerolineae bacterium CG_4_9_14_3_um_filter_57_17]